MKYTPEELKKILNKHKLWLEGKEGGECADLSDAYLRGANLRGAYLSGADLSGADLSDAYFDDLIFCVDRIGSAKRRTTYNATKDIVWCGCFWGTFEEWVEKIRNTYSDESNVRRKEYEAAVAYFKALVAVHKEDKK